MLLMLRDRINLQDIMGSFGSKWKNKKQNQQEEKPHSSLPKPQQKGRIKQQKKQETKTERQLSKRQRKYNQPKRGPLTFKSVGQHYKKLIDMQNILVKALESDRWLIDPQIIQQYRGRNTFQVVQQSPALSLQLILFRSGTYLIGNADRLEAEREKLKKQDQEFKNSPKGEYAIIYADIFSIRFQFLKKIKLKGPDKSSAEALLSLEPIASIQCPLLEELTADGHPLTNIRFLRRCIWPFLSKLSIKGNNIVDSNQIAKVLPTITNVQHIEGIDLAGQFSYNWTEVGWICKMGFRDAETEFNKLQNDQQYYYRYYGKVLRRVDCSLLNRKVGRHHIQVIKNKFNNPYFDNPISLW